MYSLQEWQMSLGDGDKPFAAFSVHISAMSVTLTSSLVQSLDARGFVTRHSPRLED